MLTTTERNVRQAERSAYYLAHHRLSVDEIRSVLVDEFELAAAVATQMADRVVHGVLGYFGQSGLEFASNHSHSVSRRQIAGH